MKKYDFFSRETLSLKRPMLNNNFFLFYKEYKEDYRKYKEYKKNGNLNRPSMIFSRYRYSIQ